MLHLLTILSCESPNRIDIDERGENANLKSEFGHFEADCIVSKKGSDSALPVIVDKKRDTLKSES